MQKQQQKTQINDIGDVLPFIGSSVVVTAPLAHQTAVVAAGVLTYITEVTDRNGTGEFLDLVFQGAVTGHYDPLVRIDWNNWDGEEHTAPTIQRI
ncbi:hypothetical protein [Plantibacter flavus]|uniref:hypothetical protein n=1 Tax=Plantibacter flavus TaxID=150123 RepID=UPI000A1CCEE1|nr:hypothetical protein [Plantibacter flavus]